jgi:DNA polymerase V
MRRKNLATANIAVWIEANSFKPSDRQYSASKSVRLPVATADTRKLITAAIAGLAIIFKPRLPSQEGRRDLHRFGERGPGASRPVHRPDDARSMARMAAIDALNARYGRGAVAFGTAGERQAWGLRREFISPRYTTVWDELLRV